MAVKMEDMTSHIKLCYITAPSSIGIKSLLVIYMINMNFWGFAKIGNKFE